jgi:putative transposase
MGRALAPSELQRTKQAASLRRIVGVAILQVVRLAILLKREGWKANHKKVYRLYHSLELAVRTKRRRKLAAHLRTAPPAATRVNERWSADFVSASRSGGHDGARFGPSP